MILKVKVWSAGIVNLFQHALTKYQALQETLNQDEVDALFRCVKKLQLIAKVQRCDATIASFIKKSRVQKISFL